MMQTLVHTRKCQTNCETNTYTKPVCECVSDKKKKFEAYNNATINCKESTNHQRWYRNVFLSVYKTNNRAQASMKRERLSYSGAGILTSFPFAAFTIVCETI